VNDRAERALAEARSRGRQLRANFRHAAAQLITTARELFYADGDGAHYDALPSHSANAEDVARVEFVLACADVARVDHEDGAKGAEITIAIALRTLLSAMGENGAQGLVDAVYANEEIDNVSEQTHGPHYDEIVKEMQAKAFAEFIATNGQH
jgi:hypothetical protein